MKITTLLIILNVLAWGVTLNASASEYRYYCRYPMFSNTQGVHDTKETFEMGFIINTEKETAFMVGSSGWKSEVQLVASDSHINLIEITGAQNITTTTITLNGLSIHSRNTVFTGNIIPSQYYGQCAMDTK